MPHHASQKNIIHGTIQSDGIHFGNITYTIEQDFKSGCVLFLRLDKMDDGHCSSQLSIKSKHGTQGNLATLGESWFENIELSIPPQLFEKLQDFQAIRRGNKTQIFLTGLNSENPSDVITNIENQLGQLIFDTFFKGEIGKVCTYFIQQLEEKRIEELLLVIYANEETIVNLPFEMVLPLLLLQKQSEIKKRFGLVRTKIDSLEKFNLQSDHTTAAPLKMLFITALPENLGEDDKMLQIEEEQTRLIRAIGALEATGDKQPKIVIEFLENASLVELDKALNARQHDIVHISGHGAYQDAQNKGVLYFENEEGDLESVSGDALGETLGKHACVKLLILSACETAIAGIEGGVAEQAASHSVPSIIAMRFSITDEGAKIFTTELYTQLAKGLSLTCAMANAREELLKDITQLREQAPQIPYIAEWFTPVIYQNQAIGALVDRNRSYLLPENFYTGTSDFQTPQSRLIGEGFIGRKRYLIQLRQAFRAGRHVCLYGLGGLGKTTLAEAFAHNYDNHSYTTLIFRKDHQINEAYILQTLQEELAEINPSLGKQVKQAIDDPQTELLDKLQLLIDNYLQGRKTILIFDNVEDVQTDGGGAYQRSIGSESLSTFLKQLCANTPPNCHILFTTRYKIEDLAEVLEHLALDKLGYAEQYRLLNYSETLRTIPLEVREDVYKRLDGHPRGYEYLEALLKKDKTFSWQQVSQAEADVLENLLLAKVYERLTKREKAIFQIVAVFISRSPLAALAAVSSQSEADLIPVLQALQDWSLCFWEKDGRFEVHRLTREWMAQKVTDSVKMKEWSLLAGNFFKAQSTWNDKILAKNYFELAETWEQFAIISFNIQDHYHKIGLYQQAFELNQAVLEKNIEERIMSFALSNMGLIFSNFGQYDQALASYEQSLAIAKKIGHYEREGSILINISQIYSATGDYDIALRLLEKSLTIKQQIGDLEGQGTALNNIGQIYLDKRDYHSAMPYLEQSLAIFQQIGDRQGESATLNNLGTIAYAKGDHDTALRYLEQSLVIYQQIGYRKGEGATLNNISQIYGAKDDYDTALRYLEQSLAIKQQIGDRKGEGTTLSNLATTAHAKGDYDTALRYMKQSLVIAQQIGDLKGEGAMLNNISQILKLRGDYDTALRYLEQSLAIMQQIGDRQGEDTTLKHISQIYDANGDYDTALRYLEQSLVINQQIGDHKGEGATLNNIGQLHKKKGIYDAALRYLEQSLAITQQIGNRTGESITLNNIGQIYGAKGDYNMALRYLEQSLVIKQQIGDHKGEGETLNNIGEIYDSKGDYDTALRYLEQSLVIAQQIGNLQDFARIQNNIGSLFLNQKNDIEQAILAFWQSYNICQKLGSPNIQFPAAFLKIIIERIGEEKFQEIISKMQ